MKTTTMDTQIAKQGQSVTYRELLKSEDGSHKLRITIKTDSHAPQAKATIERHDGSEWKALASILPDLMTTNQELTYQPQKATAADFSKDRHYLLNMAAKILA